MLVAAVPLLLAGALLLTVNRGMAPTLALLSPTCYDNSLFRSQDPRHQLLHRSMSSSQHELVSLLAAEGRLKDPRARAAMTQVDRASFVHPATRHEAYSDHPLPIGCDQTISAPHMHAVSVDLLAGHLVPGARVLDVGSGSGYLTAVMGLMVQGQEGGHVLGVEVFPELAAQGQENVRRSLPQLLDSGTVAFAAGDAQSAEILSRGPFDAIHTGATATEGIPGVFLEALKPGGRLAIPVGGEYDVQVFTLVDKDPQGRIHVQVGLGCSVWHTTIRDLAALRGFWVSASPANRPPARVGALPGSLRAVGSRQ